MVVPVALSCAIQEPPPGGPEDTDPPAVVATVPAAGSSGVAPSAVIELSFGEKMTRARLERLLEFRPSTTIEKAEWKGNTVRVYTSGLHPDTTYIVELRSGYADNHGVRNPDPFTFAFATSAKIDSGTIEGRVYFRRLPSEKGRVRLFTVPKDSAFAPEAMRPDREVGADGQGVYRFEYLPTDNQSFILMAFQDANGNLNHDRDKEAFQVLADTLKLTASQPSLEDRDIYIVDPTEPGKIEGIIVYDTGRDSVRIAVTLHELADTLPPSYYTVTDEAGSFSFDALQGRYVLHAFLDLMPDSLCGFYPCPDDTTRRCQEPCVTYPDTITVEPGGEVELDSLVLTPPAPPRGGSP